MWCSVNISARSHTSTLGLNSRDKSVCIFTAHTRLSQLISCVWFHDETTALWIFTSDWRAREQSPRCNFTSAHTRLGLLSALSFWLVSNIAADVQVHGGSVFMFWEVTNFVGFSHALTYLRRCTDVKCYRVLLLEWARALFFCVWGWRRTHSQGCLFTWIRSVWN